MKKKKKEESLKEVADYVANEMLVAINHSNELTTTDAVDVIKAVIESYTANLKARLQSANAHAKIAEEHYLNFKEGTEGIFNPVIYEGPDGPLKDQ